MNLYTVNEIALIKGEFYSSNRYALIPDLQLVWHSETNSVVASGGSPVTEEHCQQLDEKILSAKIPIFPYLKHYAQWVGWIYQERNGKWTKPPMSPYANKQASSTDAKTWGTWQQAYRAMKQYGYAGLGFVLTKNDPFVVIDLDDCRNPETKEIIKEANWVIQRIQGYTEVSPSKRGVKKWAMGKIPQTIGQTKIDDLTIEVYDHDYYMTVTGYMLPSSQPEIVEQQEAIDRLYSWLQKKRKEQKAEKRKPRDIPPPPADLLSKFHLSHEIEALAHTVPPVKERSQEDQRLIAALVGRGATDEEIITIFQQYPIGKGKYGERGLDYLQTSIKNAREWVGNRINPPTPSPNGSAAVAPPKPDSKPEAKHLNLKNPKTSDYLTGLDICGFQFRLNDLDDTIEANGKRMNDGTEAIITNKMRDIGLDKVRWVKTAYIQAAYENVYNPLKELLTALTWDGNDHITFFVDSYITEKEHALGMTRVAFRRWLVGAVAKVFEQGQNVMMVWDGPQNIGKSTLARWLCPWSTYFIEAAIKPDNKDSYIRLIKHLVWEVAELQAVTRKADKEALKDFITKTVVTERHSYGHFDFYKPAVASHIGTINEDGAGFLTDTTGDRRYLIVSWDKVNHSYRQEMDSKNLWAQAVALYRNGETWQLTPEELNRQKQINSNYRVVSTVASFFHECFTVNLESQEFITTTEILRTLEAAGLKGNQDANSKELSRILTQLGAIRGRAYDKEGGNRPAAYKGLVRK